MIADFPDTLMRMAAFEHVRRLGEVHDHLTAAELKPGFVYQGERIPLINPQRGIFKPASQKPVGNSTALGTAELEQAIGQQVMRKTESRLHRKLADGDAATCCEVK